MIEPVYYPESIGVIFKMYVPFFFLGGIVIVASPAAPTRSVSTLYVAPFSKCGFVTTISYDDVDRAMQFNTI